MYAQSQTHSDEMESMHASAGCNTDHCVLYLGGLQWSLCKYEDGPRLNFCGGKLKDAPFFPPSK